MGHETQTQMNGITERRKILLAEDGIVNQRVAIAFLEKWGHEVIVAKTGRAAVEAVERESFDLVLMDIQMPEMNGVEATVAIRAMESANKQHLLIVAMTADATNVDQESFLAAGLDDFICKPINPHDLQRVISKAPVGAATEKLDQLDWARLLKQAAGKEELACSLAKVYLDESQSLIEQMREALKAGDTKHLFRAAHTLKGASSYFGAKAVMTIAEHLQQQSQINDLSTAETTIDQLTVEVGRLVDELKLKLRG